MVVLETWKSQDLLIFSLFLQFTHSNPWGFLCFFYHPPHCTWGKNKLPGKSVTVPADVGT